MKHFYNVDTIVATLQPTATGLRTVWSLKIFAILLLGFFLLVSRKGMAQDITTIYNTSFQTNQRDGITATLSKGYGPSYPNDELTVSTGTGSNDNSYNGWIYISTGYTVKANNYYNLTIKVRVDGSGTNKDGVFSVKVGNSAANIPTAGQQVINNTPLVHTDFREYGSTSFSFQADQPLIIGIYINGSRNNSSIHFDDIIITERCKPLPPKVVNASSCNSSALTLTASGAIGNEVYQWYNSDDTKIPGATGATFTTETLTKSSDYKVAIVNGTCESTRVLVKALIGNAVAPVVTALENCGALKVTLTATGGSTNDNYVWSNLPNGTQITTANNTSTVEVSRNEERTITVKLVKSSGCASEEVPVFIMKNNTTTSPPTAQSNSRCGIGTVALTASGAVAGESYRWYSSINSTEIIGQGELYITPELAFGTTKYYVSKYNTALGCESARVAVDATVANPVAASGNIVQPQNPVVDQPAIFKYTSTTINEADVESHKWYTLFVGSEVWQTGPSTKDYEIAKMPGNIRAVKVELTFKPTACYSGLTNRVFEISDQTITPLPVELVSFKAQRHTQGVNLTWVTASEQDNSGFEVQVSTDSKTFEKIGFVESKVGTTSIKQNYSFLDTKAVSGTRYYRLKQIDLDGTTAYSSIQAVALDGGNGQVAAYPNPFEDVVIVKLNGVESRKVKTILATAHGLIILQREVETTGNTITIDTSHVTAKGIYIIHVMESDGTKYTFKMMKK